MSSIYSQNIWPERKYIIYKTTNFVNGMWYIGMRILKSKNDEYLGSGKRLKQAIKKYGKHNFKREILYAFNNKQDMINKEIELVNEDVVNDNKVNYNMKLGGEGGCDGHTEETKKKQSEVKKGTKNSFYGQKHTKEWKKEKSKQMSGENHPMWGKRGKNTPAFGKKRTKEQRENISNAHKGMKFSEEHKRNLSKANKGKFVGENNPRAKFTKEQVIEIKNNPRLYQYGGVAEIARKLGVKHSRVQHIKMGITWSDI